MKVKKMYRPEGWKNPRSNDGEAEDTYSHYEFEDGADALLEGLFKMAKESPTGTFIIDSREYHVYCEGSIPEEEYVTE